MFFWGGANAKQEEPVVLHQGTYQPRATTMEAVFVITGLTIGAGVLALPYAISTVGIVLGVIFLAALAAVTLLLHLMLGEIAVRTNEPLQLPGLAGKYLGRSAKRLVSATIILRSYGALLAYVVGAGSVLAALFGGGQIGWSVIFWSLGSAFIWAGLHRVKQAAKFLSFAVMLLLLGISLFLLRKVSADNLRYFDTTNIMLPISVILFALSATPAVAEAHALLPGSERRFRRALIFGTILPAVIYLVFIIGTVGTMGPFTTPVATLGLGERFGGSILTFGNLFAVLAMSTAFMGLGTALKQSFTWDHKISPTLSTFLVAAVPITLFLLGVRQFIIILEVVGGVFIATENIIMAFVYYVARTRGDITPRYFKLGHARFATSVVLAFFLVVAIASGFDVLYRILN